MALKRIQHAWIQQELPSQGVFYGDKLPGGIVHVRKFTVDEEAVLQSPGMDALEKYETIVSNCLRLPAGIAVRDLLTTDRQAAVILQRIYTFGPKYGFSFRCRHCGETTDTTVDLVEDMTTRSAAVVREEAVAGGDEDFQHVEPFPVKLPDCGYTAHVRFMRGTDEMALARADKLRIDPFERGYFNRIARMIVKVEGEGMETWEREPDIERVLWLRSLTSADTAALRAEVDRRETGIDTKINATCSRCGARSRMALPFNADFFLPSSDLG